VEAGILSFQAVLDPGVRRGDDMKDFFDGLVKSRQIAFSVIPAEAGIQSFQSVLDPGVRRGDDLKDFLRVHLFYELIIFMCLFF
jgi:hypothetical protein